MGNTLREEFAVCMLAGFGVPAEVGIAAADRLRALGYLLEDATPSQQDIEDALREPLRMGDRSVRYRFFRTKAKYLARGLQALQASAPNEADPLAFRAWFRELPGVGPKTASFITRNWLGSDLVAILDVHVVRACQIVGLFPHDADLARDYVQLERLFLEFARGLGVSASWLDAVIWDDMRELHDDIVDHAMDVSLTRPTQAPVPTRDKRVTTTVG
jgi:thermostable 8-oxoguanine DNA glycosylase